MSSKFVEHPIMRFLASRQLTFYGLIFLFILTVWGTVFQVDYGLYAAKQRFFSSWFFLIFGLIPFPGAQLVMWALALNLLSVIILKIKLTVSNLGLILVHGGMIVFLVGGFMTYNYSEESSLSLAESAKSNVSVDYMEWEVSAWKESRSGKRRVYAQDAKYLEQESFLDFPVFPSKLIITEYYENCLISKESEQSAKFIKKNTNSDPLNNNPGVLLSFENSGENQTIMLHSSDRAPTEIEIEGEKVFLVLRNKQYPLPLTMKLIDFKKEEHPGTAMARNFESTVEVDTGEMKREVRIFMNNPFRYEGYSFYQSSFSVGADGTETSVFSVVRNEGRLFPYIASVIMSVGLLLHFAVMLLSFVNRRVEE